MYCFIQVLAELAVSVNFQNNCTNAAESFNDVKATKSEGKTFYPNHILVFLLNSQNATCIKSLQMEERTHTRARTQSICCFRTTRTSLSVSVPTGQKTRGEGEQIVYLHQHTNCFRSVCCMRVTAASCSWSWSIRSISRDYTVSRGSRGGREAKQSSRRSAHELHAKLCRNGTDLSAWGGGRIYETVKMLCCYCDDDADDLTLLSVVLLTSFEWQVHSNTCSATFRAPAGQVFTGFTLNPCIHWFHTLLYIIENTTGNYFLCPCSVEERFMLVDSGWIREKVPCGRSRRRCRRRCRGIRAHAERCCVLFGEEIVRRKIRRIYRNVSEWNIEEEEEKRGGGETWRRRNVEEAVRKNVGDVEWIQLYAPVCFTGTTVFILHINKHTGLWGMTW